MAVMPRSLFFKCGDFKEREKCGRYSVVEVIIRDKLFAYVSATSAEKLVLSVGEDVRRRLNLTLRCLGASF